MHDNSKIPSSNNATQSCQQIARGVKAIGKMIDELIAHQAEVPALRTTETQRLFRR